MPVHPLEYKSRATPTADRDVPLKYFRITVIVGTCLLNLALLLVSINDVYPRGRPGVHNFTAMLIAILVSPTLNGLMMLISLLVAAVVGSLRGCLIGRYVVVAVVAPALGALLNLVAVLVMVPWHGSAFTGLH